MSYDYDLLVIGSGPGGQRAAIQAAKVGRRSAVVEKRMELGGVSVNTGTIASKTLRETVIHLTGQQQKAFYGTAYRVKADITFADLRLRSRQVIEREIDVIRAQLARNHVEVLTGVGSFVDEHSVAVSGGPQPARTVTAENIVITVGTRPARPAGVEFDDRTIIDSDGLLQLDRIPREIVVVGAGVIGVEYASMFAALGSKVTLVESRHTILDFCDAEIVEGLRYHLRDEGVTMRLGETVVGVETHERGCVTKLASGKRIASEAVLYSAGRQGAVDELGLERVGLDADKRGRIHVDEHYRTAVPNIYAAGDVIGFPSLAATSMEQGRVAACHALGEPVESLGALQPFGIYSIPEISYVGKNEEELTEAGIPYEVGVARYRELARGHILGDTHGMLKLCVSPEDQRLLGVHVLGTDATEIVHTGQAVMALGGTLDYFVNTVFNYPTMAESYKVAALNAMNKLRDLERISR